MHVLIVSQHNSSQGSAKRLTESLIISKLSSLTNHNSSCSPYSRSALLGTNLQAKLQVAKYAQLKNYKFKDHVTYSVSNWLKFVFMQQKVLIMATCLWCNKNKFV